MKVLIVGGGGREHALAWRVKRDLPSATLLAAPGNPGVADLARCVPVPADDVTGLLALARDEAVTLTIVGPEASLAAGIVDRFRGEKLAIFGPTAAAAEIETSKAFSKGLMRDAGIPTARAEVCTSLEAARRALSGFELPVVIKASGLAAGKGVIVCYERSEAEKALDAIMRDRTFGSAGDTVVIEEFMSGEELSVFAITDGERAIPLIPAQDHKRLLDGDRGPNTGGMGAYAPVSFAGPDPLASPLVDDVLERIILPALGALRERNRAFTGLLYAGLMLTDDGPKVVEFNCRFGDPETQALMPILDASPSLLDMLHTVARGDRLPDDVRVRASSFAVTTVVAAAGYPDQPRKGSKIMLPPAPQDVVVFHAGTGLNDDGHLIASGGRVLAITGVGETLDAAAVASRDYAGAVDFEGKQFRGDIGWRELAR